MMEVLLIIDNILKLAPVRWGLLVVAIVAAIYAAVIRAELGIVRLERDAADGRSSVSAASLSTQNVTIKKAGEDMEAAKKRLQAANAESEKLRQSLKKRKVEIREIVLQGDCPAMVQQVLDEVRK